MFVQALLVERRSVRTARDDLLVGRLGFRVTPGREQQLTAPEVHLGNLAGGRIGLDDAIEGGEGQVVLARGFIGARQLVEHPVVTCVVGIGLEQRAVEPDGLDALHVELRHLARHALEFAGLQVQIAQPPQRLGAQPAVGILEVEKVAVALHRPGRAAADGRVDVHFDIALAQIAYGRRGLRLRRGLGVLPCQDRRARASGQDGGQHQRHGEPGPHGVWPTGAGSVAGGAGATAGGEEVARS